MSNAYTAKSYSQCYAIQPHTLGCQRCTKAQEHEGAHRSQDRKSWAAGDDIAYTEPVAEEAPEPVKSYTERMFDAAGVTLPRTPALSPEAKARRDALRAAAVAEAYTPPAPTYRVVSNYTELAEFATLAEAKRLAVAESARFDDAVLIERDAATLYLARQGQLYRAKPTR